MEDRLSAPPGEPATERADGAPAGPRRRGLRRLAVAVCVVAGVVLLLWCADGLTRWGAQALLAHNIQSATGVNTRPSVTVHGAFFLPQVVHGRYDDVEITARGLVAGPLRVASVHAEVAGVQLAFPDLLRQDAPIRIERSTEDATLTYADLDRYLAATGRPVRIAAAPDGQVRLTGTVRVFGHRVSVSARARLAFRDGALVVHPTELATGTMLDEASRALIGRRFAFDVPLDPLPFGQHPTAVRADRSGLHVRAQGRNVVVRP